MSSDTEEALPIERRDNFFLPPSSSRHELSPRAVTNIEELAKHSSPNNAKNKVSNPEIYTLIKEPNAIPIQLLLLLHLLYIIVI